MPTQILHQKIREIPQNYPKWVIRDWMTTVSDSNTSLNILHISCSANRAFSCSINGSDITRAWTCLCSCTETNGEHIDHQIFLPVFFSWKKNVSEKKLLKRGPFWANLDLSERQAEVPNRSPLNSLPRLQPSWWPPRTVLCTVCKLSSFLLLPKIWVAECSWIYEHVVFQLPLWMIHNDPTGNFICHQEAVKGSGSSASIDAPFTAWPGSKVPAPDMTAWPSLKIIHLSQPLGEHPLWHLQWKCV